MAAITSWFLGVFLLLLFIYLLRDKKDSFQLLCPFTHPRTDHSALWNTLHTACPPWELGSSQHSTHAGEKLLPQLSGHHASAGQPVAAHHTYCKEMNTSLLQFTSAESPEKSADLQLL